jgi:LmbE family N-acetylglucosaminyl deacetylase
MEGLQMTVLGIGAHPDDLEVSCFGTLAKYVKTGHKVYTCSLANGSLGHYEIMPKELAAIRLKETSEAARVIGAEYIPGCAEDMNVDSHNKEQQDKVIDIIRLVKPDLIISHSPDDYHSDHVETAKLVFYAAFASSLPHYFTKNPFHNEVVPIYYMENNAGINFQPQEYVDITREMELKIKALECHESQIKWLREHDGISIVHNLEITGEFRGLQCGVKYAECFVRCETALRIRAERMLP